MKQILVDANAFLRFLLNDIPAQTKSFEILLHKAKQSRVSLHISQITIFEIQFILDKYYNFDKEEIIDKLHSLVATEYFHVESRDIFIPALALYKTENIGFVDSFLISKAKFEKMKLFTFDKKFSRYV